MKRTLRGAAGNISLSTKTELTELGPHNAVIKIHAIMRQLRMLILVIYCIGYLCDRCKRQAKVCECLNAGHFVSREGPSSDTGHRWQNTGCPRTVGNPISAPQIQEITHLLTI